MVSPAGGRRISVRVGAGDAIKPESLHHASDLISGRLRRITCPGGPTAAAAATVRTDRFELSGLWAGLTVAAAATVDWSRGRDADQTAARSSAAWI